MELREGENLQLLSWLAFAGVEADQPAIMSDPPPSAIGVAETDGEYDLGVHAVHKSPCCEAVRATATTGGRLEDMLRLTISGDASGIAKEETPEHGSEVRASGCGDAIGKVDVETL